MHYPLLPYLTNVEFSLWSSPPFQYPWCVAHQNNCYPLGPAFPSLGHSPPPRPGPFFHPRKKQNCVQFFAGYEMKSWCPVLCRYMFFQFAYRIISFFHSWLESVVFFDDLLESGHGPSLTFISARQPGPLLFSLPSQANFGSFLTKTYHIEPYQCRQFHFITCAKIIQQKMMFHHSSLMKEMLRAFKAQLGPRAFRGPMPLAITWKETSNL